VWGESITDGAAATDGRAAPAVRADDLEGLVVGDVNERRVGSRAGCALERLDVGE
jgi:hypothetical protein